MARATMMIGGMVAALALAAVSPASAQSSASTYSYGTYNPVQAAINRDSMNAAIIKQATGKNVNRRTTRRTIKRRR